LLFFKRFQKIEGRGRPHLKMAFRKKYIDETKYRDLVNRYDECGCMLKSLEKSLNLKLIQHFGESNVMTEAGELLYSYADKISVKNHILFAIYP
jgi:hypothetical protein